MKMLMRLLKILAVISLVIPSVSHAQEGYAGMYGTPNPDRSGSFIASNASGSSAFIMNSGAQLCFDAACTYRMALGSVDHLNTVGITQFQVGQLNAATLTAVAFSLGLTLTSGVANGSTAVGTIIDTGNSLSTSGARMVSFRNAGSEKVAIDKDGFMFFPTSVGLAWGTVGSPTATISYDGANHIALTVGAGVIANQYANGNTLAPNALISNRTNAAGSIGTTINTANTFNIAGQKLVQILNNSVEKFAWDLNGKELTTTTDTSGTPGSGTANTNCGRSAIASGASTATITNSNVATTSTIWVQLETSAAGIGNLTVTPGSGSFVVTSVNGTGAATNATANATYSWCVRN